MVAYSRARKARLSLIAAAAAMALVAAGLTSAASAASWTATGSLTTATQLITANFGLDLASMFAVLVLIAVTGVVLNLILRLVETRLCFWSGKATK